MSQPTCPSAAKLQEILRNTEEFPPDQLTNNFDDMIASFRSQGVDIENCDGTQLLGVVRDFFANLSDEELAAASGGGVSGDYGGRFTTAANVAVLFGAVSATAPAGIVA
jgi:hypothetical protein